MINKHIIGRYMFIICEICGKKVKKLGLGAHKYRAHNENYVSPLLGTSRVAWNKGITASEDPRIAKGSAKFKERIKSGDLVLSYKGVPCTEETKQKISNGLLGKNTGKHPGSYKFIHVTKTGEEIKLQSSYEKLVAEILDRLDIEWIRPSAMFYLGLDGKKRRYFPDFYLPKFNLYLDPKNDYLIERDKEKIKRVEDYNNCKVLIIPKENINEDYFITLF